jgi:hypothetical protein
MASPTVRLLVLLLCAAAGLATFGAHGARAADATVALTLSSTAVAAGDPVTMTATVSSAAGVPSGTIGFFDALSPGSPALGSATLTPSSPNSTIGAVTLTLPSGTYSVYALYTPDPLAFFLGLGTASSAAQTLAVGTVVPPRLPTQVTLSAPAEVLTTDAVTLTATVTTVPPGGSVTGTVWFVDTISGSEIRLGASPVALDSYGMAQLVVPNLESGPHRIVAQYSGDPHYNPSSSPPVSVTSRPPSDVTVTTRTTVVVSPSPIVEGDTVTITATVVQTGPGAPAQPTGPVTFTSDSSFGTNVHLGTALLGQAPATAPNQAVIQVAGWHSGQYTITASYFGDLYDKSSSATVSLAVLPPGPRVALAYTGDITVVFGHSATVSATVTDNAGTPLAGRLVTFTVGSQSCTATSTATGSAACSIVVTQHPGNVGVVVDEAGDAQTLPAQLRRDFTVTPASTSISVGYVAGRPTSTLTATLLADTGAPIAGQPVTLTLAAPTLPGATCTAITNAAGIATCSVASITGPPTATLSATFAGNLDYLTSTTSRIVQLAPPPTPTTLVIGTTTPVLGGTPTVLSATLFDDSGSRIAGATLTLKLGSQSCTGVTDANGVARCTVPATDPLGPTTVTASFAGDVSHFPSNASLGTYLYARGPGGGSFVVGDQSAALGANVTFWGAKWAKVNKLSGGDAPDAFKGYAASGGAQCGSGWATAPGKSSDPPDTVPLPAYMAVVVTSKVTKSGSAISGPTVHVVIVRTSYASPNNKFELGKDGTGTVVAQLC